MVTYTQKDIVSCLVAIATEKMPIFHMLGVRGTSIKKNVKFVTNFVSSSKEIHCLFFQASTVAHDLHDCNQTIIDTCSLHSQINDTQKEEISNCSLVMHRFKNESDSCQVNILSVAST